MYSFLNAIFFCPTIFDEAVVLVYSHSGGPYEVAIWRTNSYSLKSFCSASRGRNKTEK